MQCRAARHPVRSSLFQEGGMVAGVILLSYTPFA